MLNFADWVIKTDWGTPLLVVLISLLLATAFIAAATFWIDSWREVIQEEIENGTELPATNPEAGQVWQGGWRTRHI